MISFLAGLIIGAFGVIATLFLCLTVADHNLTRINNDTKDAADTAVGEG